MLRVIKPGLQSTLQGTPRVGFRHLGVPYAGPADELSMRLANRLVENTPLATCIEITYGGFEAEVMEACVLAVTGACEALILSGRAVPVHETLRVKPGDVLHVPPSAQGMRVYLAIHSGFAASALFGSTSTYLPAAFGGLEGRVLQAGDIVKANRVGSISTDYKTPETVRPTFANAYALRACESAEFEQLDAESQHRLFADTYSIGRQATRMGITLTGNKLTVKSDGMMQSAPVFPGTVQCPSSGEPVILVSDAQTTGGYPRIAHVARCDRHLLGQMRPGNTVQFLHRSPEDAVRDWQQKRALLGQWLEM